MMQPRETQQPDTQSRHRTLMIIWGAIFSTVTLLFVLATVLGPGQAKSPEADYLNFLLGAVGTFVTLMSVFMRYKLVRRAIERQRPQSVFGIYIIAFAMCEVAALCGFLVRYLTNEGSYYLMFVIAAIGLLLNLPRRKDFVNAPSEKQI